MCTILTSPISKDIINHYLGILFDFIRTSVRQKSIYRRADSTMASTARQHQSQHNWVNKKKWQFTFVQSAYRTMAQTANTRLETMKSNDKQRWNIFGWNFSFYCSWLLAHFSLWLIIFVQNADFTFRFLESLYIWVYVSKLAHQIWRNKIKLRSSIKFNFDVSSAVSRYVCPFFVIFNVYLMLQSKWKFYWFVVLCILSFVLDRIIWYEHFIPFFSPPTFSIRMLWFLFSAHRLVRR